jgi:hypothetical protein
MTDDILLPLPRPGRSGKLRGAARDAAAARLRALGWALPEIAERLGFYDAAQAAAAIRRALANTVRVARDEQRILELDGLLELERALWRELQQQHILVSNGRVIRDDFEVPINDDRITLEIVDRILKVKEARSKLLGLAAPARAEILTIDSVDSAIRDLENEIESYRKTGQRQQLTETKSKLAALKHPQHVTAERLGRFELGQDLVSLTLQLACPGSKAVDGFLMLADI